MDALLSEGWFTGVISRKGTGEPAPVQELEDDSLSRETSGLWVSFVDKEFSIRECFGVLQNKLCVCVCVEEAQAAQLRDNLGMLVWIPSDLLNQTQRKN